MEGSGGKYFLNAGKLLDAAIELLEQANINRFKQDQIKTIQINQTNNGNETLTITVSITVPNKIEE